MGNLPPIIQTPASLAVSESILTDSHCVLETSNVSADLKPMVSAYSGKCTCPYGELKHSCDLHIRRYECLRHNKDKQAEQRDPVSKIQSMKA